MRETRNAPSLLPESTGTYLILTSESAQAQFSFSAWNEASIVIFDIHSEICSQRYRRYIFTAEKPSLAGKHPQHNMYSEMEIDAQDAFEINFFENLLKKDSKNPETLELLGGLYSKHEMVNQALRIDRRLARISPQNPRVQYNLACTLCLLGRKREALESLRKAIELGYDDRNWLIQDSDFNSLKNHPEFQSLVEACGQSL